MKKFYLFLVCAMFLCSCSQENVINNEPANYQSVSSVHRVANPNVLATILYYGEQHNAILDSARLEAHSRSDFSAQNLYTICDGWLEENADDHDNPDIRDGVASLMDLCIYGSENDVRDYTDQQLHDSDFRMLHDDIMSGYQEILENYGHISNDSLSYLYQELALNIYDTYSANVASSSERESLVAAIGVFYGSANYWLNYVTNRNQTSSFYNFPVGTCTLSSSTKDFLYQAADTDFTGAILAIAFGPKAVLAYGGFRSAFWMLTHDA